jgi:hypothetical protein
MPQKTNLALVDPPLSPARERLRQLSGQLAGVQGELAEARLPERRLVDAIAEHDAAAAERARLRGEDDTVLADWLAAGGDGPRPSPADATLEVEQRVARLARDASASRAALPGVQETIGLATEALVRVAQRGDALMLVVLEAAESYANGPLMAAFTAALKAEAVLEGLEAELREQGMRDGMGSGPHRASLAVAELRRNVRAQAGAPHDRGPALKLLTALATDPAAELAG